MTTPPTLEQIALTVMRALHDTETFQPYPHVMERAVKALQALQTAAKQPEGAEAWMREAQLFKDNLATHLAAAIQVGELADTDTVYIADLAELLAREHFQIISRHSTAAPAQAQPEGADWAENAAKELADELFSHRYGGIAANYATEKAAFTSNIAAIIRKHAPLVANREDSERDSKRLDWLDTKNISWLHHWFTKNYPAFKEVPVRAAIDAARASSAKEGAS